VAYIVKRTYMEPFFPYGHFLVSKKLHNLVAEKAEELIGRSVLRKMTNKHLHKMFFGIKDPQKARKINLAGVKGKDLPLNLFYDSLSEALHSSKIIVNLFFPFPHVDYESETGEFLRSCLDAANYKGHHLVQIKGGSLSVAVFLYDDQKPVRIVDKKYHSGGYFDLYGLHCEKIY
jgi:hypothetical protein